MASGVPVIKSEEEVALCRHSSLLVEQALALVASRLKPGVTGLDVDSWVDTFIRDHQAVPSFKGFHGFPFSICYSVNEQVVHGFPGKTPLKSGDIVTVDIGIQRKGYHGDFAYTFAIGEISSQWTKLLTTTKACAYLGVAQALAGNYTGDIGYAVQKHAESNGMSVVRELVGHGVGANLHEAPEVPNFGSRGRGVLLKPGMVLAVEPMINLGKRHVRVLNDQWTIVTRDKQPSAHFEHNVVVREGKYELLSSYTAIEEAIQKNTNLTYI